MTEKQVRDLTLEAERYELNAGPAYQFQFDRRDFFKVFGAGVVVLCALPEASAQQESGGGRRRAEAATMPQEIGAWLHIDEEGAVTVYTGKAEVGQNIRTSLAQAVAEELRVPVATVHMVMADTDLTPFDMGTFGSRSTPYMAPPLRKAAARELLIERAAEQWKADRRRLTASDGKIVDPQTKQSISYGQLTKGRKLVHTVAENVPLTPADQWKVAGQSVPKVDARDFVTGKHKYGADIQRPDMLHGKVLRPAASRRAATSRSARKSPSTVPPAR